MDPITSFDINIFIFLCLLFKTYATHGRFKSSVRHIKNNNSDKNKLYFQLHSTNKWVELDISSRLRWPVRINWVQNQTSRTTVWLFIYDNFILAGFWQRKPRLERRSARLVGILAAFAFRYVKISETQKRAHEELRVWSAQNP